MIPSHRAEFIGLAVLFFVACGTRPEDASHPPFITVQLNDPRGEVVFGLDDSLTLRVTSLGDMGWGISVRERGVPGDLLYHSKEWHGPYPSQAVAASIGLFGAERWLCVHRHSPSYELHATVQDFAVSGIGSNATFQRGVLVLEWFRRSCSVHRPAPGKLTP